MLRRVAPTNVANLALVRYVRSCFAVLAIAAQSCGHATGTASAGPSPSPTLPITSGIFPDFGHAPDFTWVAGRLIRSSPAGQCTYIQFSTHRDEPWGGRIALTAAGGDPAPFPTGDMVVVTGTLQSNAPSICGQPSMAIATIEEH